MVIDFDLSTVILSIILVSPFLVYLRLCKRYQLIKLILISIFYAYLVGVAAYTLFPIFLENDIRLNLGQTVWRTMNFVPLVGLSLGALKTSMLNILLFLPFGYGLPFLKRYDFLSVICRGVIVSVCVEFLQLLIALLVGFTFRVVDVNDVIFNTVGVILGYGFFQLFSRNFQWALVRGWFGKNALINYIDLQTRPHRAIR